MTTAVTPRVEYEDRFRARPELMAAAEAALAFLDRKLGTDPLVPPPAVIRWSVRPLDPNAVELAMADEPDGPQASQVIPVAALTTPRSRDNWAVWVWYDLLSERSRRNMARFDQKFAAYARALETESE